MKKDVLRSFSAKLIQKPVISKIFRLWREASRLQVGIYASHAGFFIVLSLFPSLVLFLSFLRHTGLQVESLLQSLSGFLPRALLPAARLLVLTVYTSSTGTVLSVSALTALWSASRGVYGLLKGLNRMYGVREDRGWLYTRTVSMLYTFGFLLVLLLTLVLSVFGQSLLSRLPIGTQVLAPLDRVVDLRFWLLLFLQTGLFTAIYKALPNCKNTLRSCLPGAIFSAVGWLGFSKLYSVYVAWFPRYTRLYGSVYAIALFMLWLYCCISILFYGGALNCRLAARKSPAQENFR